jgi:hypothetical protein
MAFAAASGNPGRFFAGCSGTVVIGGVTGVFIPHSSLESYGSSNSGEIGELLYSVMDKVASGILALPSDDRPSRYRITRSTSSTGDTSVQKTFSVSFDLNARNTVYDLQSE